MNATTTRATTVRTDHDVVLPCIAEDIWSAFPTDFDPYSSPDDVYDSKYNDPHLSLIHI